MALIPLNTFKTKTAVLTTAQYNQAKCFRDTQLIVDSLAFDLLYNGNTQSIFAGLQYWAQGASKIPGEVFQTLSALQRAEEVARKIVVGELVIKSPGNTAQQDIRLPHGNADGQTRVSELFNLIASIIENGTAGSTDAIVANGGLVNDPGLLDTADILSRNKEFLQNEIIAFLTSRFTEFTYDRVKCARDTRLLVDSLAFDVLFQSSTQSEFAGLQYWIQDGLDKPEEATETIAAFEYLKNYIITNTVSSYSSSIKNTISARFDDITDLIKFGTIGVTDKIVPNGTESVDPNIINAYGQIQTNKAALQTEVINWLNANYVGYSYNQVTCSRDVGYIIDCVSFDLLFNGNRQSIQAGVYYFGFSTANSAIPTEQTRAIIAFNYMRSLLDDIVTNNLITDLYQAIEPQVITSQTASLTQSTFVKSQVDTIVNIIKDGPTVVGARVPIDYTDKSSDQNDSDAFVTLLANKDFLAAEVTAFVDAVFTNFTYNKDKCARDTGLIVDSVAFDILYQENSLTQSEFAGLQYWAQDALPTSIPDEAEQTATALEYARDYVLDIILTDDPTNLDNKNTVASLMDLIVDIIRKGPRGTTDRIRSNGTASIATDIINTYDLIQNNKGDQNTAGTIIGDVISWINAQITENQANTSSVWYNFSYNPATCARDLGYILDCVSFDLLHSGNRQTIQAGVYYFGFSNSISTIPTDKVQSLEAYKYLKSLLNDIITGVSVANPYQTAVLQVIANPVVSPTTQVTLAESALDAVLDIIDNGPGVVGPRVPIDLTKSIVADDLKAFNIILANKEFIKAEIVAFVENTFFNMYRYNRAKCKRDTRLIVDSLAYDILFDSNTQTEFAGLQYWAQGATSIPNESAQTLAAIAHAKSITQQVVLNSVVQNSTGNTTIQFINTTKPGSATSSTKIGTSYDLVSSIITSGTANVTNQIVSNGLLTTDSGLLNAYSLIQNNKKFIQDEVVAWINVQIATNTGIWQNFTYQQEKCYRDVGYILDSIAFDMLYGGNRQSIQAGVYYYNFSNTVSVIEDERAESMAAFNYLKSLIDEIVTGQVIATPYQQAIKQVITDSRATITEANVLKSKINTITNIINNGPGVVNDRTPISLVENTNTTVINAFNLLIANKEFLAEEVAAFVDDQIYPTFEFDKYYCRRDIGYIVDCMVFDIERGGNRQSTQAGVYYYDNSSTVSIVPTEKTDTVNAYTYLRGLLSYVVRATDIIGQSALTPYQSNIRQNKDYPAPGSVAATTIVASLGDLIDKINTIIETGPGPIVSSDRRPPTVTTAIALSSTGNNITINKVANLAVGMPVYFENNLGNIIKGTTYFVASINPSPSVVITVSTDPLGKNIVSIGSTISQSVSLYGAGITASTDIDVIKAYELLMVNKEFLAAEIVGYMNSLTTPNTTKIYTAPPGVTAIVLLAQVANVTDRDIDITFAHYRNLPVLPDPSTSNGFQAGDTLTEIVKGFTIPPNDSASLINGKMIIESFDSVVAYASESGGLKITLSILETANA